MIEVFEELASTSAALIERIAGGATVPAGTWIVANRQTSGRGRQGRAWCDGQGNFMGSTFIRSAAGDPPVGTLSLVAGLAVREAVLKYAAPGTPVLLKWPNDLLVEGAKLSGILLEGVTGGVVVGIGVNLAVAPELPDRRTVSLDQLGKSPSRDEFTATLAQALDLQVERWRTYGLDYVIRCWDAAAHPIGTMLRSGDAGEGAVEGAFAGLAPDGSLQLRLADGSVRAIHAGEINLSNGS